MTVANYRYNGHEIKNIKKTFTKENKIVKLNKDIKGIFSERGIIKGEEENIICKEL